MGQQVEPKNAEQYVHTGERRLGSQARGELAAFICGRASYGQYAITLPDMDPAPTQCTGQNRANVPSAMQIGESLLEKPRGSLMLKCHLLARLPASRMGSLQKASPAVGASAAGLEVSRHRGMVG